MPRTNVEAATAMAVKRAVLSGSIDPSVAKAMGYDVPVPIGPGMDPIKIEQAMLGRATQEATDRRNIEADIGAAIREKQAAYDRQDDILERQRDRDSAQLLQREKQEHELRIARENNAYSRSEQSNPGAESTSSG